MEILLTFAATGDAIRAEELLLGAGLPVKVMSLPSSIRAGCGICLRLPPKLFNDALEILRPNGPKPGACYTRNTVDGKSHYTQLTSE